METKDTATTEENQISTTTKEGNGEFSQWVKKLTRLAQKEVKKEIALHKANGHSIFYLRNGMQIMELADGRCFEYRRLENGSREIIREVHRR